MRERDLIYKASKKEFRLFICIASPILWGISYLFYKNIILSFSAVFILIPLRVSYERYLINRKKEKVTEEFKDFMYCISSSVSVGKSMRWAIDEGWQSMRFMYDENKSILLKEIEKMISNINDLNFSEEEALKCFADNLDIDDIRDFADVYSICEKTGGNLQKVILNTIVILTDKINVKREIRAVIAQRQFEGKVVTAMPIVILMILNLSSEDYLQPLYETVAGRVIMTVCLVGFILSALWIVKILEQN